MKSILTTPSIDLAAPAKPAAGLSTRDKASLKKSSQEFEALLIGSMFKAMRKTVPEGGLFEKSNAHEMYEEMLDQEVAKEIAKKQSLGLADQIYRQMEKKIAPAK